MRPVVQAMALPDNSEHSFDLFDANRVLQKGRIIQEEL